MGGIGANGPAGEAVAQPYRQAGPSARGGHSSLDVQMLRGVYEVKAPVFRMVMRGADYSAYPVFFAAPIAAWGGPWLFSDEDDWTEAYSFTVAAVATYGATIGLKKLFQRPRPYLTVPDIRARADSHQPSGASRGSFALPSGHAAMSFAIFTSLSWSYPKWYVIGPGAVWATTVSLSRLWLGVHYPSDVLTGALLGTALSVGIHLIGPSITPNVLKGERQAAAPPMMGMKIRF